MTLRPQVLRPSSLRPSSLRWSPILGAHASNSAAPTPPPAFSPTTVANLGAWYDAANAATRFRDTSFTTPVTAAGQNFYSWSDASGNVPGLSEDYPGTYQTDDGGYPCFDGSSGGMMSVFGNAAFEGANFTIFSVVRQGTLYSPGAYGGVIAFNSSPAQTDGFGLYYLGGNVVSQVGNGGGGGTVPWNSTGRQLLRLRYDGTAVTLVRDRGAYSATNAFSGSVSYSGRLRVGLVTGGYYLYGRHYEHLVYTRALTGAEITSVEAYLSAKWGTP